MKGERRHELKEDEFAETVAEWGEWLRSNQKPVGIGVVLVLVVGAFIGWYVMSVRAAANDAWLRLAEADESSSHAKMMMFRTEIDPKRLAEAREELIERYQGIARDLPDTYAGVLAMYRAGNLLYEQQKYDDAMAQYERVIKRSPNKVVAELASSGIGYALEGKGQCAEAAEQFARTAASAAGSVAAQSRVDEGRCLERAGRPEAALEAYRKAVALGSETAWAQEAQKRIEWLETAAGAPKAPSAEKPEGKPETKPEGKEASKE